MVERTPVQASPASANPLEAREPLASDQGHQDTIPGPEALAAVQEAWNGAARRWDPVALAAVYTPDALFFGGRPGHAVGACAIRDYFASYDGIIESGSMELMDQHIMAIAPTCLLAQGYADFSFVLSGGRSTKALLRTTLLIVLQDGQWKICQHHFSPTPSAPPLGDS
jgi:uncharacterized protein (TIGR02246 family)